MTATSAKPRSPVAFSYIRFSDPKQRDGNSVRRQTEARERWLADHPGVPLDTSLKLTDRGKSGFRRKNWDSYALARFVEHVKGGLVRPGDYLLVENLDRLSREEAGEAVELFLSIVNRGVIIVQLLPNVLEFQKPVNTMSLMFAIVELSRGHSESAVKSERTAANWELARRRLRDGLPLRRKDGREAAAVNGQLPAWVEEVGGKLVAVPGRAAAVRRIYQLAAAGYGHVRIVKALKAERREDGKPAWPAFGGREAYEDGEGETRWRAAPGKPYGSGQWTKAYVALLLKDRRVLGEWQPRKDDGSPDGPPVKGHFPQVVTPEEWEAARAGALRRAAANGKKTNNSSKHVDVFAGLVRDARDGGGMFCVTRTAAGRHTRVYVPTSGREGRLPSVSFPYATLERGLLARLAEVPASEALGPDGAPAEADAAAAALAGVEAELAEASAYMEANGFSLTIARRVTGLEKRQAELGQALAEAQAKAARPAEAAWDDFRSLAAAIDDADDPDDARLRVRTALRRTVEDILLLVVPRGHTRLAAVQVYFAGGRHRDYLLLHQHGTTGAAGARPARSWAKTRGPGEVPGGGDLRDPEQARQLAEQLSGMDLEAPAGARRTD
jgi:DNA invertase Pin-like site-specific DNA recombinase